LASPGVSNLPRVLLAGTHSSVGKTTVTVGLLAALRRLGGERGTLQGGPGLVGSILGSYVHLSFAADQAPLARFVRAAAAARESGSLKTG
jgi:cobyrinic acid a,c-diamide synthase